MIKKYLIPISLVLWGHGTGWVVTKDSVASKPSSRAYGIDYSNWSMFIPKPGKGYDEGDYCYNQNACHFAWNRLMEWNNYGWTQVQP